MYMHIDINVAISLFICFVFIDESMKVFVNITDYFLLQIDFKSQTRCMKYKILLRHLATMSNLTIALLCFESL